MPKTPSTAPVEPPASAATDAASVVVPNAAATVTRSPSQWAEAYFPASGTGRLHPEAWKHASAETMHGWRHYVARTGKQVQLTAELYEAAIAAVSGNDFKPHAAADYRSRS